MGKLDLLRSELEKARQYLHDKGYHYDGNPDNYEGLMAAKPFEIQYQDVIEKIWPENCWWEVTHYWDIFDAMMGGLDDGAVIDEIIKHVDKEFLNEAKESTVNGAKVEYGHSLKDYFDKFGDDYDNGKLWDFSKDDFEGGAIEPQNIVYWYMQDLDGDWRYFETNTANECVKEEKKLDEGTSNFGAGPQNFPLLVFYTYDEVFAMMDADGDQPHEWSFEDDEGNVDYDAYEKAREEWEQNFWDNLRVTALDEDEVERLEDILFDFNKESEKMAWDADYDEENHEQKYDVNLNLEDVKVKIEAGYYEAAYIAVEHEDYLEDLEDGFRDEQYRRFNALFDMLKKDFHLTQLSAGPAASNGERFYKIVDNKDESLKEDSHQEELGLPKDVDIQIDDELREFISNSDKDGFEEFISNYLSDKYGFCHFGWNYDIDANEDCVHVTDIDWDTSDEGLERDELESLDEKKSKRKYKINFTGDPAKNAAFFNHAMGSDGGVQQETTSLGEEIKRHYYEYELGVILEPGQGEYDSYKMDGVYGGQLSFYDESQGAFPEDELDELKEDCKKYVEDGVNGTYAIIKGPFDLDDGINVEDIEEFCYDLDCVIWSYRKDKDGNIVEDFLKVKNESLDESNKKFALVVNGEWYSTYDSYEKADKAREKFLDSCSNEDDAREYYGELPNIEIKEIDESLNESMKSEVTKWWHDVEDSNKEMQWGFNIDNGDGEDVEAMHAAMFDMLDALKEKGAGELFKQGKKIYNKYAISKYNESLNESKEELKNALEMEIAWCKSVLNNPKGRQAMDAKANYGKDYIKRVKDDLAKFEKRLSELSESLKEDKKPDREMIADMLKTGALDDINHVKTLSDEEFEELVDYWVDNYNTEEDHGEKEESLKESSEVARVEYCVMDELNNNIECFDNTDDAIAFAKENEGVRVLEVKYGPKNEHGDEPELSAEEVWSIRESLEESLDFEEMKRLLEGLEKFLREEDSYYELWFDEKDDTINAEITWGDWKHDHLWFDHVAEQYLKGEGYEVIGVDVDVTEEDGSDTYSAIHSLKIRKKPKVEEGASYRGLAYFEYPKDSGCHVRETPSCFVATDKHGTTIGDSKTSDGAKGIIDDYLAKKKSVEEGLDGGSQYYYIKYWEDEELRDQGISEIYMDDFKTKEDAIHVAKRLIDFLGYASVEVFYSPSGDIESEDDELVFGYDGVDTWGNEKNESLNEELVYGLFAKVKGPEDKKFKDWENHKVIETGKKEEMKKKIKEYEDSWNVNKQGNVFKFFVELIGDNNH